MPSAAPPSRRAAWASAAGVVAAALLGGVLVPLLAQWSVDVRWALVLPLVAGAVAPRPGIALGTGAAAVAVFLAGVWVRGPHGECDPDTPETAPAGLGPAMQGCFDQPELNVVLFGLVGAVAWGALAAGAVAGGFWRGRRA